MDANVAPQWLQDYYTVRQKVLAIGKTYFIDDASNRQIAYCKMKIFKFKEDIRIYTDDSMNHELLSIKQEQILDWVGTFKITDSQTGQVCGFFQRRPLKSMFRDEWVILDANKNEYGKIIEDSGGMAMLRRFIKFIPKTYKLQIQGQDRGVLTQKFKLIGDTWWLDLRGDPQKTMDRRVMVAGAIMMDAIEQAQGD